MHPILFQTKYFTINTLWFFVAIGIIVTIYAIVKLSIRNGLKLQFLSDNSWKLILWTLVGARIVAILTNINSYFYEFSGNALVKLLYFWDKGLNIWGATITFFIYFYILCKKKDQDFFKWLDVLIPAAIIGMAISHVGAFFEGINYGSESSLPWSVNFESPAIKYAVPIHPTQIYAAIYSTLIAITLIALNKSKKIATMEMHGLIGLLGIGAYQLFRFLEEFLRGDDIWMIFGIRSTQIFALTLTISTGIFIYFRYNKPAKNIKHNN